MSQLIIVRGLPGSGKTTFADALAAKHFRSSTLLAADDFFTNPNGTYAFDVKKLSDAHQWCQDRTLEGLQNGRNVIVHNTFVSAREFSPYLAMSTRAKVDFRIYNLFDAGLSDEELAARNGHGVPVETIQRMRERWDAAPITEIFVESVDGFAHWQYPTIINGEIRYEPDWLEMAA